MQTVIIRSYRLARNADESSAPSEAAVLTPQQARQGVISGRVMLVLISSLSLAVLAGAVLIALHVLPI